MNKFNYNFVVTLGKLLFPVGRFEILTKMNPLVVTRNDQLTYNLHEKVSLVFKNNTNLL